MNNNQNREIFFYTEPNKAIRRSVFAGVILGDQLLIGRSQCSLKDQFIKKYGRDLARGRALSKTPLKVVKIEDQSKVIELFHQTVKELI